MKPTVTSEHRAHSQPLHKYIAFHIKRSGLTHREIARACGFKRPNIVSMIKSGDVRLPLERLGAMADVLGLDAFWLYCRFMEEYYAQTWEVLKPLIPGAEFDLNALLARER